MFDSNRSRKTWSTDRVRENVQGDMYLILLTKVKTNIIKKLNTSERKKSNSVGTHCTKCVSRCIRLFLSRDLVDTSYVMIDVECLTLKLHPHSVLTRNTIKTIQEKHYPMYEKHLNYF